MSTDVREGSLRASLCQAQADGGLVPLGHTLCWNSTFVRARVRFQQPPLKELTSRAPGRAEHTVFPIVSQEHSEENTCVSNRSADQYADLEYSNPLKWHTFKRKLSFASYSAKKR